MNIKSVKEHGTAAGGRFLPWFSGGIERCSPGIRDLDLVLLHQLCPRLTVDGDDCHDCHDCHDSPCLTSAAREVESLINELSECVYWSIGCYNETEYNWMANLISLSLPCIQVSTRLFAKPQGPMSICSACWWSRCFSSWDLASQNIATSTRPSHLSPFVSFFRRWSAQAPHSQSHDGLKEKLKADMPSRRDYLCNPQVIHVMLDSVRIC
jgi:hypothetical protein